MSNGTAAVPPSKTRQQVEDELLTAFQIRQQQWREPRNGQREFARQSFVDMLQKFNALVMYNTCPIRVSKGDSRRDHSPASLSGLVEANIA